VRDLLLACAEQRVRDYLSRVIKWETIKSEIITKASGIPGAFNF
jgi:hypothetical protein